MAAFPEPNYVNPQTRVAAVIGLVVVGLVIMTPFVVSRLYARYIRRVFWVDDWIIVAAAVSSIISSILSLVSTKFGIGYHIWDLRPGWLDTYLKMSIPTIIMFNVSVALPKISLCFTYLRLFVTRRNTWFCYAIVGVLSTWLFCITLVTLFECRPMRSYWDLAVPSDYCINGFAFHFANALINSITDFLVYLWPVTTLWQMNMPRDQRLRIILVFALGALICVAGAVRTWFIYKVCHTIDQLYEAALVFIGSSVEVNCGIAFACLHATKPVMCIPDKLVNDARGSSNGAGGSVSLTKMAPQDIA